jgi:tight adherence protein B
VRIAADKVRRKFGDQLPDNLQVLASALRAGHSFSGALKTMTNDAPEPSKTEYRRVVTDEQLGISIETSLNLVSERMKNEEVAYIGLIATLQRETGGNTAEVLDRVTQTIRERMKLKRLVSTLTAQGRFGGWIVTALPVAMVVILSIVKPDYMDPMLANIGGIIALVAAALMVVTGAIVIRKIVDIDV